VGILLLLYLDIRLNPNRSGQATVTYIIEGAFTHEDSAGHKGTIKAGGVQYMTAGKGVVHSEIPVHGPGLPNPVGLQLWVDLPGGFTISSYLVTKTRCSKVQDDRAPIP
jgi:Pirin